MKRSKVVPIRFTESEHEGLSAVSKERKISLSELVRRQALGRAIPHPPEINGELLREVRRIGNNVNQIARTANTTGAISPDDVASLRNQIGYLTGAILETLR